MLLVSGEYNTAHYPSAGDDDQIQIDSALSKQHLFHGGRHHYHGTLYWGLSRAEYLVRMRGAECVCYSGRPEDLPYTESPQMQPSVLVCVAEQFPSWSNFLVFVSCLHAQRSSTNEQVSVTRALIQCSWATVKSTSSRCLLSELSWQLSTGDFHVSLSSTSCFSAWSPSQTSTSSPPKAWGGAWAIDSKLKDSS